MFIIYIVVLVKGSTINDFSLEKGLQDFFPGEGKSNFFPKKGLSKKFSWWRPFLETPFLTNVSLGKTLLYFFLEKAFPNFFPGGRLSKFFFPGEGPPIFFSISSLQNHKWLSPEVLNNLQVVWALLLFLLSMKLDKVSILVIIIVLILLTHLCSDQGLGCASEVDQSEHGKFGQWPLFKVIWDPWGTLYTLKFNCLKSDT